jgi:hypothetical protein
VFSLAFRDPAHGVAVGGDYQEPDGRGAGAHAAWTADGGRTWTLAERGGPSGYRSAVAVLPGEPATFVAVGPGGTDLSADGGKTWKPLAGPGFDAVGFAPNGEGWAVGEGGRIARFVGIHR